MFGDVNIFIPLHAHAHFKVTCKLVYGAVQAKTSFVYVSVHAASYN